MRYIYLATLLLLLLALVTHKPTKWLIANDYIHVSMDNGWQPVDTVTYAPVDTVFTEREPVNTMAHVDYMRFHIGIPNMDTINMWLAFVGLKPDNPFCSASASYALTFAGATSPTVRSGLARNFVYKTPKAIQIDAKDVYKGMVTVSAGSMVVYQRGETIFGHNGFVTADMTGEGGIYISANTSAPGSQGSESAGGGVYEKPFRINPYSYFRVTDFVIVSYD